MKKLAIIGAALLLCGCNTIRYTQTSVLSGVTNSVTFSATRVFWSTENYDAQLNPQGGGALKATKSNVDSAAILAVGQVAIQAMQAAPK